MNEVLNGIPPGVPLGAVPGGGTNVFARALGLPRDPVAAAGRVAAAIRPGERAGSPSAASGSSLLASPRASGWTQRWFAASTPAAARATGAVPATSTFASELMRVLAPERFAPEPFEIAESGARPRQSSQLRPLHLRGPVPLARRTARRGSSSASTSPRPRAHAASLPRFVAYLVGGKRQPPRDILERHDLDRIEISCDRPLPLQADGEDLGDVEHVVFEAERDASASGAEPARFRR